MVLKHEPENLKALLRRYAACACVRWCSAVWGGEAFVLYACIHACKGMVTCVCVLHSGRSFLENKDYENAVADLKVGNGSACSYGGGCSCRLETVDVQVVATKEPNDKTARDLYDTARKRIVESRKVEAAKYARMFA